MESRVYTARELLRMRCVPLDRKVADNLRAKVQSDSELVGVVRVPVPSGRPLPLIKEEPQKEKEYSDSRRQVVAVRPAAPQLDGTDSEWKYVGRSDSEHTETHPISAPPGLAAQKAEGFQRFYKAVVSPTHVRVTAGGRIVPNNRGSQSPTTKWARERNSGDVAGSHSTNIAQSGIPPYQIQQPPYGTFPAMMNGIAPNMHPGMAPGTVPYPIVPVPMGYNMAGGYAMPPPTFNHFQPSKPMMNQSNGSSRSDKRSDKQSEGSTSDKEKPLLVSPPEQFDPSRPFYFNGQWMMPNGHPFYQYNVMPPQGFQTAQMPGQMMMPPERNGPNPTVQNGGNHMFVPPTAAGPGMVHSQTPPISSIRPSEITKKQIESLRVSMRYFEDQLQYNKHQIDEKGTEEQAQMVRGQIEQFERNLENQLAYELTHYPKTNVQNDDVHSTSSKEVNKSDAGSDMHQSAQQESARPAKNARERAPTRATPVLNSAKSVSAFQSAKVKAELAIRDKEIAKKASSLPITAALAPPFQPRAPSTSTLATAIHAPQGGSGWRSFFKNSRSVIDLGGPYLVGRLPHGMRPEDASESDYVYGRKLTKDERRARHMYWGKTPRSLQKGLPKFDGKDFYPPSPNKGSSSDSSIESASPTSAADLDSDLLDDELKQPVHNDPFEGMAPSGMANIRNRLGDVTQSESLPPQDHSMMSNYGADIPRPFSCVTQVSEVYREFCQPGVVTHDSSPPSLECSEDSCKDSPEGKSSPNDSSEDSEEALIFQGRQGMVPNGSKPRKSGNTILNSMLRKGKTSANVAPGKVSPTTAQGVIPNYAGHAAASLTPAIANTTPTSRGHFAKATETNNPRSATERRSENRPPVDRRLDDSRRGVSRQGKGFRNMDSR
ncbi:hypothetical protein BKA56DRAFT_693372 [Ilyonectria sp. MPI-CAGE-AT-0026]|nr:hypothetical protein BKA56DRAFT_693372 [Ilyonectria sp. MPI-CAGE-AT-0026]